jgi:hypothetical protein
VVLDPTIDFTKVELKQFAESGGVARTSLGLLATDPQARFNNLSSAVGSVALVQGPPSPTGFRQVVEQPLRQSALAQVQAELTGAGLLGTDGKVSSQTQNDYSFEVDSSLPTPGVLVKGCLDDCSICEAALDRKIQLELDRKELENKLLERQIALLEKSQEYRCCPAGSAATP